MNNRNLDTTAQLLVQIYLDTLYEMYYEWEHKPPEFYYKLELPYTSNLLEYGNSVVVEVRIK